MESLWQYGLERPEYPKLDGTCTTDVLVIGGGLAGILTAWCLKQKGIASVVVEKDRIASATTAHTTAKISAQHGLRCHEILKRSGEEWANMYFAANMEAAEALKTLCRKADCGLEEKDNFVYSANPRKIEQEMAALQKIGVAAKLAEHLPDFIPGACAVGLANQGQFHPLKLIRFLSKDLNIYESTKVTELIGTTAVTDSGRIQAKKLVIATHFPFLNKHGSYFLKLYQHRSYVLALKNAPALDAMYVDDSLSGMSFSSFDGYFLLGGGGHRTGKQGGSYPALRAFAKAHLEDTKECFHWAAQDTMSLDGIPYIGHYSRNTPDVYVAAGFNKWGMTGAMLSASLLSDRIAGMPNDYAPVFSPSRSILRPQLAVNCLETAANFLYPTTRRCPHLGCALKYNKQEHSWDCSCHGSRFLETGEVLDNPANGDLKRKPTNGTK